MFGKLISSIAGGYALPFVVGEPYNTGWGAWTHYRGTTKDETTAVSVFRISAASKSDPKLVAARNGVKRLKLLRHPNLLVYKDTAEVDERGETVIYLVTEPVKPLDEALRALRFDGTQRADYLAMGLYHIANAVSFLNNDCNLIHGNVCMGSVVVTDTLDWKLHGLDLLSEHQWSGDLPLTSATWMVASQYKPAEVAKGDWQSLKDNPPWAVDAWGLGCLMAEAFHGVPLSRTEDLRDTEAIPPPVLQYYQRLLASQPARRLNPIKLLESAVFKTKLVETVAFLENLAVKDVVEKDTFFKRLPSVVPSLPQPVNEQKILPLLASALEFGGAPPTALTTLLKISTALPEDEYAKKVVPTLSKLFASTDRTIRKSLLENIDSFGRGLPAAVVEEQIFPPLSAGFTDSIALMRELTLKSMIVLAPKLSQRTINQSLLKFLAKLQVDEEPSIRANTTILLGNLAEHLSESTCKRVLLNAFTRALKDPFPPARVAGLKAMMATSKYYSPEEAAARALPCVTPLAVDPVHEVRAAALTTVDIFLRMLREAHEHMGKPAEGAEPAAPTTTGAAGGPGWSSWAMSSLGLAGEGGAGAGGRTGGSAGGHVPSVPPPAAVSRAPAAMGTNGSSAPAVSRSWQDDAGPAAPPQPVDDARDGWDNDEDLMLDMEDAEEKAARERLARMGTGGRATTRGGSLGGGGGGGSLGGEGGDGLDSLMAEVAHKPAGSAPPRGRGRGAPAARRPPSKSIKLGATKMTKTLGDDWGADDF